MGPNVVAVFLDEFLFMNPKAFPAIFPTTATGAMLVITSSMSPGGDSSALKLLDVKYEDGSNVINKHNWVQVRLVSPPATMSFSSPAIRPARPARPKVSQRSVLTFRDHRNSSTATPVNRVCTSYSVATAMHTNERCCMLMNDSVLTYSLTQECGG